MNFISTQLSLVTQVILTTVLLLQYHGCPIAAIELLSCCCSTMARNRCPVAAARNRCPVVQYRG